MEQVIEILLVEDDKNMCEAFEYCIRGKKQFHLAASTGKQSEGLELLRVGKMGAVILDLELKWVPTDKDNLYANRVGEIDWQFTLEAYDDPSVDNPKTGDYIMMAVAIMAVSGVALAVLLIRKKRKK